MKRLVLVLALVAVGVASLFVGSVTITSGEGTEFKGKVSSPKKQCRENRKVTLYMKAASGGSDSVVGSDKTDPSGAWTIGGSFLAGEYYARVASVLVHANGAAFRCSYAWTMPARF
jgi:hypothetical protein